MTQPDLGKAVIVFEDPDDGTVERSIDNKKIAYFQDHWIIKLDEDEAGNDIVRRIPVQRVHYVERSVQQFEEEVQTLRNRVESFAHEVQSALLNRDDETDETDPTHINVESESEDKELS